MFERMVGKDCREKTDDFASQSSRMERQEEGGIEAKRT